MLAAALLIALKLVAGLTTGSFGLVAEALHSGTDLVAALLTFIAVGVAFRPPDQDHPYGHGKAEHLAALAEATFLAAASVFIAYRAVTRLTGGTHGHVDAAWYALALLVVVMIVDVSRALISLRASRRYKSAALRANALHFAGDFAGSTAVLAGLILVRFGYPKADAVAAIFVAVLVLIAAGRLMRANIHVLMDHVPGDAELAARDAIESIGPDVQLRRLRIREAAGRHFADVVIGVPPTAAVAQGHALADTVEQALEHVLPGSDVVVHVEPREADRSLRERARAAALTVPDVYEIHNLSVLQVGAQTELSLHLKLPADMSLNAAHAISSQVEAAITRAVPEVHSVQTHIEPLADESMGVAIPVDRMEGEATVVKRIVLAQTGHEPRQLRFMQTEGGIVVFLTLAVDPSSQLTDAHDYASRIEGEVRAELPRVADIVVHTEP